MIGFENASLASVLERVNGAWWVLDGILVVALLYYFWVSRNEISWSGVFHWDVAPLYLQAAAGILVFHLGDLGVRFLSWWLRHQVNSGHGTSAVMITIPLLVFSLVAGTGLLCLLRVFSNALFGKWIWLVGAGLALGMAMVTRWLP